jgi:Sec-independent protein translocase protein TatA
MTYTVPFNLIGLSEGVYTLWFRGLDNLGHSCTINEEIYIDTHAPMTSIVVDEPKYKDVGSDFWNITSSTSISIDGQFDIGSGLDYIEYRITNTTYDTGWMVYISDFNLPISFSDGVYNISYRGVDNLGNIEIEKTELIFLDNTGPESYVSMSGPAYRETPQDIWNISSDSIIIKGGDDGAWGPYGDNPPYGWTITDNGGIGGIWDTNDWHRYFFNSSLPGGTGTYAARVYAYPIEDQQDEVLITTTIDVFGYSSLTLEYDHYYDDKTTATMDYGYVDVRFDGGSWSNVYTFSNSDNWGHELHTVTVPPSTSTMEVRWRYVAKNESFWFVDNVMVSSGSDILLFEDFDGEGSGTSTVWHRIYGNDTGFYYTGWRSDTSFSLVLPDGNYTIEYYAVDHLSNYGSVEYLMLYLDNTPPQSSSAIGEPKYRLRETDLWILRDNTSFLLSGWEDLGSGLSDVLYSIINDTNIEVVSPIPYTQPFNLSNLGGDGQYTIRYWAVDNLDNTEIFHELTVILDRGYPSIEFSSPIGSSNSIFSFIKVIFTERVDHDKAEQAFSITDGTLIWDWQHGFFNWADRTMTFYPYDSLPYGSTFFVTINITVTDFMGNRLDGDGDGIFEGETDIYTWDFATIAMPDLTPPTIVSVYPIENSTSVGLIENIEVEFSEGMDEFTCEDAFLLAGGGKVYDSDNGNFTWIDNNMTFLFDEAFLMETEYTVTISNIATDISGNHLTFVFSWKFTTHGDITSPIILSHTPSGNDVSIYTNIIIEFNEPMNETSVEKAFVIIPFINGSYDRMGNTFTFTPESKIKYETQYYVIIGLEAKDVSGNALSFPYEFNFTTEPDLIAPTVIAYYPSGVEVDINTTITITFDEPMQQAATEAAFSISPHIQGTFLWIGNTLIFTPDALNIATVYTVTIGTGAVDLAGNSFDSPFQFTFTTKLDPYPPIIEEYSPTGSDVPVDTLITIRFNEAMNESSLHIAFEISPYVPGAFSFENYTLIFKPSGNLAKNTLYNVTIKSSARDLAGNHLGFDLSWKFTTEESEPEEAKPVAWDVYLLWIFIVIIVIILLLVFYEFFIKRRKILARGMKKTKEDEGEIDGEFDEHEEKELENDEMGDEEPKEDEGEEELEDKEEEEITGDEGEIAEEEPGEKDEFSEDFLSVLEEGFGLGDTDDNK